MSLREYIPFYKRNLKVALPIMLTQAGQVTVQLADNIMIGHVGTAELAAVSFANSIIVLGMVFGIGFTQGLTPHIGQNYGKGEHGMAAKFFQSSLVLNCFVVIVLSAIMFLAGLFMDSMGQTEEVVKFARQYYYITLFSMFPFLIFFGMRQFSEGIGITKYAMYITIAANILNIFLNWVLIFGHFGFEPMGVRGAAISTVIGRSIMLISFIYIMIKLKVYKKYLNLFKLPLINIPIIKNLLKTSIPLSLQNLVEITAFSFSAIMVGWNGKVALASHQIAMSMSSLSFMLALGIGAAATIRVSHQYGSGDYVSMRRAGFASVHLSVVLMSLFGLAYIFANRYIPMLYTTDTDVIALAAQLLILAALFQIFDATQLACLGCLRALKDVKVPLFLSVISYYFVCLPMGYICGFVFGFGARGVWVGLMSGLIFVAILFFARFNKISKRLIVNIR